MRKLKRNKVLPNQTPIGDNGQSEPEVKVNGIQETTTTTVGTNSTTNALQLSSLDMMNRKDISGIHFNNAEEDKLLIKNDENLLFSNKNKDTEDKLLSSGVPSSVSPQELQSGQDLLQSKQSITNGFSQKMRLSIPRGKNSNIPRNSLKEGEKMFDLVNIIRKKKPTIITWSIIGRISYILKFIRELKKSINYRAKEKMNKFHYKIIGDKAHIDKDESNKFRSLLQYSYTKHFKTKIQLLSNLQIVFSPDHILLLIFYNVIILAITICIGFYEMVLSSFDGANGETLYTNTYENLRLAAGIVLCVEICMRLNTGTYKEGVAIYNRSAIIKEYIHVSPFGVDLITSLALLSSFQRTNYLVSLGLFFLRTTKIWRLSQDLNDHFRIWYRFPTSWILIKLFFMIILFAHFWGCQFHYIARLEEEAGLNSWLKKQNLLDESALVKYINAFYFSTISMITIGYGDITPQTTVERFYVTVIALLGSCVFSYIVNTIGSIFQEISNKEAAFKQQKNNISDYMAKRSINQKLQLQVIKYLDYTCTRLEDGPQKGQIILNQIAKNLQEEIKTQYFGNILKNCQLFSSNFSNESLLAMSLKFKEVMYGPGEIIFEKGQLDCKIFFIQSGEVSLFIEKQTGELEELTRLGKGQMFGQFGFIGCRPREMAVKCSDTTDLVYLENADFVSILKNYQDDYEKYSMMKDEVNFKDRKLNTKCSSCGSFDHTLLECSLVLPQFNRFRIAIRHIYPVLQKRQAVIREGVKFHTFLLNKIVREDLIHIRQQLAMRFEQNGEIEELSEDSDNPNGTTLPGSKLIRMDDRDYFLNQKMQFQLIDGEIVNIESDATSNNLTEQSMSDNQPNKSRSRRFSDASSFNESIPEITVRQQQYQRQVSIMKNPNNLYMRQNTAAAKQSLFRLESLANAAEIIQKDASPVLSKGSPQDKNKIKSVFGGLSNNKNSQLKKKVSIVVGGKVMDDEDDNDEYREIDNNSKTNIDGIVEENEKRISRKTSGSKGKIESEKSIKSERSIKSNRNITTNSQQEIEHEMNYDQPKQFQRHLIHTAVSQIPEGKSEGSSSSIGGSVSINQNIVDTASELRIDLLKLVGYNSDSNVSSMRMSNKNQHNFDSPQMLSKASTFNKSNSSSNHLEISTSQFQPKKQLTDEGYMQNKQRRSSSVNNCHDISRQKSSENRIEDIGKCPGLGLEGSDSDLSEILSEMNEQESQQQLSGKSKQQINGRDRDQIGNFEKKSSIQVTSKEVAEITTDEGKDNQEQDEQLIAVDNQSIKSLTRIIEEPLNDQDLHNTVNISNKIIETDQKYTKQQSNTAMLNQNKIARQATTLKQSLSGQNQILRKHSEEQTTEISKDFTIPIQHLMVNISTNQDQLTNQSETPRADNSPNSSVNQQRTKQQQQQSSPPPSPISVISQDEVIHKEQSTNRMGFGLHRFQHLTQQNNEGITSKLHKQVSIVSDNNQNEDKGSPETPSPLQFGRLTRQLSSIKNGLSQGSDIRKLLFARASSKILGTSGEDLPPLQALHVLNTLSSPGQEYQHGQIVNNNVFQAGQILQQQQLQQGLISGSSSSGQPESSNPSTPSRQSLNSNASAMMMMKKQPLGFTPTSVESFSQQLNKQQQFHQVVQKGGVGNSYPSSSSSSTPRVGLIQRNSENNNSGSSRKHTTVILPQFPQNSNSNSVNMPTSQHKINNNNSLTEVELENQYENGDLFIYDFDIMKEFKIYYPHLNYKKVLYAVSKQRKPQGQNKSLHNNAFIQKLMNKKKQIPRRLPSLMKQFDLKELKEEEEE